MGVGVPIESRFCGQKIPLHRLSLCNQALIRPGAAGPGAASYSLDSHGRLSDELYIVAIVMGGCRV